MMGNLVKAFENTLRIMLLTVALSTVIHVDITPSKMFDGLLLVGLIIYGLSALIKRVTDKLDRDLSAVLPIVALVIVFGTTAFLLSPTFEIYKLAVFIGYMAIWVSGSSYEMNSDRIVPVRNRFAMSAILLAVLFFALFKSRFDAQFHQITGQYFPIYGLIGLLYLNIVNMRGAYELNMTNAINKDINVKRFSGISAAVAVLLIVMVRTRLFGLGNYFLTFLSSVHSGLIRLIEWIIYPIAYGMSYLVELIKAFAKSGQDIESGLGVIGRGERLVEFGIFVEAHPIPQVFENVLAVFAWTTATLIAILMVIGIYKRTGYSTNRKASTGTEERSFIFDELNPLHNLRRKEGTEKDERLKGVRLAYKNALMSLKKVGLEKKAHETPDEFLSAIKDSSDAEASFSELTDVYKHVRYGGQKEG